MIAGVESVGIFRTKARKSNLPEKKEKIARALRANFRRARVGLAYNRRCVNREAHIYSDVGYLLLRETEFREHRGGVRTI